MQHRQRTLGKRERERERERNCVIIQAYSDLGYYHTAYMYIHHSLQTPWHSMLCFNVTVIYKYKVSYFLSILRVLFLCNYKWIQKLSLVPHAHVRITKLHCYCKHSVLCIG